VKVIFSESKREEGKVSQNDDCHETCPSRDENVADN